MDCEYCKKQSVIYNHGCLGCLARHVLIYAKYQRQSAMLDFCKKSNANLENLQAEVIRQHKQEEGS
jgi:hypothetical protein